MTSRARVAWIALALVAASAIFPASCAKGGGGGAVPTTSPTGTGPTEAPGTCATENPNTAGNLVIVDIGSDILPTIDPTYGSINGYGVDNINGVGGPPTYAMIINQWTPSVQASPTTQPITSSDILQFTNIDGAADNHSAISFPQASFPPIPYVFPSSAASPSANTTIGNGPWSTGEIPSDSLSGSSVPCYSQTFTLRAGTYYFGDFDNYNDALVRDVLVVTP
jgi:hypothetical protein